MSHSFDADGFLTQRGGDSFVYSMTGQLLRATLADGTLIQYAYDATDRLMARIKGDEQINFMYANPNKPYQLTATQNESTGQITVYHYDELGTLIGLQRDFAFELVVSDQVGTPQVVLSPIGIVRQTLERDAYGRLLSTSDPFAPHLWVGFAGGIEDPDTGLVRLGARDYDPETGRWTARDPILFEGGQGNLYVYSGNSPVMNKDENGLLPALAFPAIGAAVGAGFGALDALLDPERRTVSHVAASAAVGAAFGTAATYFAAQGVASYVAGTTLLGGAAGATSSVTTQLISDPLKPSAFRNRKR